MSYVGNMVAAFRAINRRYATPSIEMTPLVKVCLLTLRLYLFVLVGLMIYKFIVTVGG
jgi:hypothetical protein